MSSGAEHNQHNAKQIDLAQQALHAVLRRALKGTFTGSVGIRVVVKRDSKLGGIRTVIEEDIATENGD